MENKILIRTLVSSEISEELYEMDQLKDLVGITDDDELYYSYDIADEKGNEMLDANYSYEVTPIEIDKMIELLNNAKKAGATHAGIFYHNDHTEYEVYGYNYQIADEAYYAKKAKEILEKQEAFRLESIKRLEREASQLGIEAKFK